MWPATDLCWTCQKNNNPIHKTANLPDREKAEAVRRQEEHLHLAAEERILYKNCCQESKGSVQNYIKDVDFLVGREPCSYDGTVHYSYGYAEQLHYPTDPNQPGPIYFKVTANLLGCLPGDPSYARCFRFNSSKLYITQKGNKMKNPNI